MRPLLFLFLFVAATVPAAGADAPPGMKATDYLALRGSAGGTEFNAFRRQTTGAALAQAGPSRLPGYLAWKNTCVPVARMAAGGSFKFATGNGFADVTPYVLLPEPTAAGWLELLAAEFAPPAGRRPR